MKKFKYTGGDSFENFKESYKNAENCTDEEINKVKNIISSIREETLEEAAEKFVEQWFENGNRTTEVFNAGAKWQQERSYSEEDMRKMYDKSCGLIGLDLLDNQTENNDRFKELFAQFKKK